jgi:hypothetical protein
VDDVLLHHRSPGKRRPTWFPDPPHCRR